MCKRTYINEYSGCMPVDFCNSIIEKFEKDDDGQYQGRTIKGYDPDMKESIDLNITKRNQENEILWKGFDHRLWEYITETFKKYCIELDIYKHTQISFIDTTYNIHKYLKNEGYFKPHNDCSSPITATRFVSIIIYLNNVSKGGETYFENWNIKVKPEAGKIVLFPASFPYIHEGFMPISNDKYVITTFILFPELTGKDQ